MALSIENFKKQIQKMFLNARDKNQLFKSLRIKLRTILQYPEHIQAILEILSDQMPLYAAVSAGYFQQHGCLPDKLPVFMTELRDKCETNFIKETNSSDPCIERCADLHTAFSYLTPEHTGSTIPKAVESLSETQREVLFQEVGRCIKAIHDTTQEERNLLDPILKYFSLHYPEEINGSFLKQNQEVFSDLLPKETTLSGLLIDAIKRQYFSYFRVLYTLFPSWHMNQREITSAELIKLGFQYADSPEYLLDMLYVALELAKEGHSYHQITNMQNWHDQISALESEFPIDQAVSYLYYVHCIETNPEHLSDYIHSMPIYEPDELFLKILPGHKYPTGGIFVQENTETILKQDSTLLKDYLDKLGKNNIYHFDTDLDCPDAESSNCDYSSIIREITSKHSAEEILFFYFNTHLRKVLPLWELKEILEGQFMRTEFNEALRNYVFTVTLHSETECPFPILQTSQFNTSLSSSKKLNSKKWICLHDWRCEQRFSDEYYFDGAFPKGRKFKVHLKNADVADENDADLLIDEELLLDDACHLTAEILLSEEDIRELEEFQVHRETAAAKNFSSILCEVIQTNQFTETQRIKLKRSPKIKATAEILVLYADALEALSCNHSQQVNLIDEFEIYYGGKINQCREELLRIWNLIKYVKREKSFRYLVRPPFNLLIDIADIADILPENGQCDLFEPINGKIFLNPEGQTEFVQKEVICKKSKIIVQTAQYNEHDVQTFQTKNRLSVQPAELADGTEGYASIQRYDKEKNCFLCKFTYSSKDSEKILENFRILDEIFEILKKAVTDDTAITTPPQKIFSESDVVIPAQFYSLNDMDNMTFADLLYEMIANRMKFHRPESIAYYLDTVKKINTYVCFPDTEDYSIVFIENQEKFQNLLQEIIKECSAELIARIYCETHFHLDISLNQWLSLANQNGKLSKLIENLQGFEIHAVSDEELLNENENSDYFDIFQNITIDLFSVDGNYGEEILVDKPGQDSKFRIIGYDAENDIVLLTKISEE